MASPRSAGENGVEDGADAVGDAFQLVAQGMAQLQEALREQKQEAERKVQEAEGRMQEALRLLKQEAEREIQEALHMHKQESERKVQEAENRMQEALRLQEERAATALREMKRKLQEKDDAIRSLQQRNEETLERQTAVDELTPEGSGGQRGLQRLEDRMEKVEASVQSAFQTFLPRVEAPLNQSEEPQSARASLATAASNSASTSTSAATAAASTLEAPATGKAEAGGREEHPFSTPTPTISGASHQGAADDEHQRARQLGEQLCDAAEEGRLSDVRRLVDSGADVNYTIRNGSNPLMKAVFNAHADVVSLLLQRGADVNAVDPIGCSALNSAAMMDRSGRCVELLVRAGADVNARQIYGQTPLHTAALFDHSGRCVELLVRAGADVNARDEYGAPPLNRAICFNNEEAMRALIAAGARMDP